MSNEFLNLKSFGLNIALPKNSQSTKKVIDGAMKNFLEPVMDYFAQNDEVFNGNVGREIDKLNIQTMNLGFAAREGETIHRLDTKG